MKLLKLIIASLLLIPMVLGICGCSFDMVRLLDTKAVEKEETIPKIAFGTMPLSENSDEIVMKIEEFNSKNTEYDIYRSDYHYSKLSEDEKFLYRCFQYALENGYSYTYIDDLIVSSADSFGKVLNFLALDSPLLEQNLIYQTGTFTTYYEIGLSSLAKLDGVYLYVENINSDLWKGKIEAIKRAKEIVADMPEGLSEKEKAKYLHRYTVENLQYHDYTSADGVCQHLRDAVIDGKANCDGSANMFSLLLNIAGIDCYENMYSGENIIGHTWNMIEIDGVWYNADATAQNINPTEDMSFYLRRNFAFSDKLERYVPDYDEIYPTVTDGLEIRVNTHIEKLDKTTFVKTVELAFSENKENFALLLIDNYNEKEAEEAMQRLADSLRTEVFWYSYEVVGDRTVMAIYC